MSRQPRHIQPGTVYHLISRFVDREWFIQNESERRCYLDLLGKGLESSDWRCISFAVMSNHVHLATLAGAQPLDAWIRRVHSPFADRMNRAYNRIGPMFVRGPKALPLSRNGVGSVIAYIHNNPVRANIVSNAAASRWTSHRAYVGEEPRPRWLHVELGLSLAGFSEASAFSEWAADPAREQFDQAHELEVTMATPRTRKARDTVEPAAIVVATAVELGITVSQLRSRRRSSPELIGREVAVHCAERIGVRGADIARALGVTQQAVSLIRCRGVRRESVAIGARVLERIASAE